MLNNKLENLINSLKESYFKTPVSKRYPSGAFTKEFVETASKEIKSIQAWFSREDTENANKWATENLPNWEGSYEQIKTISHFIENFILVDGKDDKFVTDQLLYRGCLSFNESPYFIELLKFFEVDKFVASTEIKSASIMALMNSGYKISLIEANLTSRWQRRASEYTHLFLIEK